MTFVHLYISYVIKHYGGGTIVVFDSYGNHGLLNIYGLISRLLFLKIEGHLIHDVIMYSVRGRGERGGGGKTGNCSHKVFENVLVTRRILHLVRLLFLKAVTLSFTTVSVERLR